MVGENLAVDLVANLAAHLVTKVVTETENFNFLVVGGSYQSETNAQDTHRDAHAMARTALGGI